MRLLFFILVLSVVVSSCQKESHKAGRFRLVEATTYRYGVSQYFDSSVVGVSQYQYRHDSSGRRQYDNPRENCDTFLRYVYHDDGEVQLVEKEVRAYNHLGLEDTFRQFNPSEAGQYPLMFTTVTYRDTLPVATHMYGNAAIIEESTDTMELGSTFLLTAKQILAYTKGELSSRTFYTRLNNQDSDLVCAKNDVFENNRLSLIEDYTVALAPVTEKTALRRETRYVYDSVGNELSSNVYIVYEDSTEALWDKNEKTYNMNGQLVAHSYTMHAAGVNMEWVVKYTYSPKGEKESMLSIVKGLGDKVTLAKYTYNSDGKVVEEEITEYEDEARTQLILKKLTTTTYNPDGLEATTSLYYINEDAPKDERKHLVERTVYTYEAY